MSELVLLLGGSGRLGRHIAGELLQRGYRVRALLRSGKRSALLPAGIDECLIGDPLQAAAIRGLFDGVQVIISALGASLSASLLKGGSYHAVDFAMNKAVLDAAPNSLRKFIYVSVFGAEEQRHLSYMDAHEQFVDALRSSDKCAHSIIRPTGFFGIFSQLVDIGRTGIGTVFGDGSARTNPIHEADVAHACVAAIEDEAETLELGGPEILSRREIVAMAMRAAGRKARIVAVPPRVFNLGIAPLRPVNPRLHALLQFSAEIFTRDCIAPLRGTQRLEDYLADYARRR